jgi:RNA polymerase sigma-70 factor, ECF subfamily
MPAAFNRVDGIRQRGPFVDVQPWVFGVSRSDEHAATEAALVRASQAGDRAALDQLLARHERGLLAFCRGILRHAEDAEDAAQETLFRAVRGLPRFEPRQATFRTWLFRVALNVCLDWKRDHRPTEVWDEECSPSPSPEALSPETLALRRLQVMEALSGLPAHRRAILLLKELEGWSAAEIGRAMGWSLKRVYNELYNARCSLAEWQARNMEEGAK